MLIDRESLINELLKLAKKYDGDSKEWHPSIDFVLETILRAPVVERKGHWEDGNINGFVKCSECGAMWETSLAENMYVNYCPRCGAMMEGLRETD